MKTLPKILLLAALLTLFGGVGKAQQCGAPGWTLILDSPWANACPLGPLGNNPPYLIIDMWDTKQVNFHCVAQSNVQPPPPPGTVYFNYDETTGETGYGERYCNYHSSYSSYDCPPNVTVDFTVASSPSDYNRFYNRAYSFAAVNGACPQSGFEQDFQQCNGLQCAYSGGGGGSGGAPCQPTSPVPYCGGGGGAEPYWNAQYCSWTCCVSCPVIIDTAGRGFVLTDAQGGVTFDIQGNGQLLQMAWTSPNSGDAFLALPGPDGLVHDGRQLFGNWTPQPPSEHPNGFAALAVWDDPKNGGNGDGVIDAKDAVWPHLRLWIDENHDGICQPEEMHTLPSMGINSISLHYTESRKKDEYGNEFRYKSRMNPDDPDEAHIGRLAYDVFFAGTPLHGAANNLTSPALFTASGTVSALAISTANEKVRSCPTPDIMRGQK